MRKIRVLIVDDSTVIRKLVSEALSGDPELEVVGTASNGRIALQKIPQLNPDVVTLDIEMPEMDGLATLAALRKTHVKLPVIMFSTLTQKGAVATIEALSLGASDYVTKPDNVGSVMAGIAKVREDLIPKIKAFCAPVRKPGIAAPVSPGSQILKKRIEIIAIGVSTGGPNALTTVFRDLPGDLRVPIVVVQHMPPVFTNYLAQRLDTVSPLKVAEARAGETPHAGGVWLAPGGQHLALRRSGVNVVTALHEGPPENSCRPAVDVLFRSVAELYGPGALAIILTGMGHDGLRGCEAIRDAGGLVLAQDEASSVVWGMPGAVASAGLAHEIIPIDCVASRIQSLTATRSAPLALASVR